MRKYYWYFTAFVRKHGMVMLVTLLVGIGLFSIVLPRFINAIEQKPRRYVGVVGSYTIDTLPTAISERMSIGLTRIEPDGTIAPGIADRWIAEDEGRTYRFMIRSGLVWQDGKPVQADDLTYTFKDVELIKTAQEVVFKLPDAYVPFPTIVSQPLIRFQEERHNVFFKRQMPIGIGTHRVIDYSIQNNRLQELVLDNPQERLIFRFYLTEDQAVTAFKHGAIDILPDMTATYDLETWPNVTITPSVRADRYVALFFNNASPLFTKNVRQGLSYALPKAEETVRALGPISRQSWVYLDSSKRYDHDIERGIERLLDEIPSQKLAFELTTTATFETMAESIKREFESFGAAATARCKSEGNYTTDECDRLAIEVTIRVSNFPDTSQFQALLIGQEIPPDPDQYFLWHSEQTTNFTNFRNTRIDALLERGRTTIDATERRAIYQEFQQFFLEDAPAIFLEYLESNRIERS